MEWNDEKVGLLISEYESQPCLYDFTSTEYRIRHKKKRVIEAMAKKFGVNVSEIAKKLKYVRNQYAQEVRKEQCYQHYRSKWKFYKRLSFLRNFVSFKQITINLDVLENETITDLESLEVPSTSQQLTSASSPEAEPNPNGLFCNDALIIKMVPTSTEHVLSTEHVPQAIRKSTKNALISKCTKNAPESSSSSPSPSAKSLQVMQDYFMARLDAMSQQPIPPAPTDDTDVLFSNMLAAELKLVRNATRKRKLKQALLDIVYKAQAEDATE